MSPIRLTEHSDGNLYSGITKVVVKRAYGGGEISLDTFSVKDLERAISDKTKEFKANAYEPLKANLVNWSGEYHGQFRFYEIDKSALTRKKLELY